MVVFGGDDNYKCTWLKADEAERLLSEVETELAHEITVLSSMMGSFENECEKIENKDTDSCPCLVVTLASIISDVTLYAVAENTWSTIKVEISKSKDFKEKYESKDEYSDFFDECRTNLKEVRTLAFDFISGLSKKRVNKLIDSFPLHLVCRQFASVMSGNDDDDCASLKGVVLLYDSVCALLNIRREFEIDGKDDTRDTNVVFGIWCRDICKSLFSTYIEKFVDIFPHIFIMDGASLGKRKSFHTIFVSLCKYIMNKKTSELETDAEKKARLILEKYCGKDVMETIFAIGD